MADPADNEHAWQQWWDVQHSLCHEIDVSLDKAGAGRSDQFGAALVASMIEHLSERLRAYLHLPEADDKPEGESDAA